MTVDVVPVAPAPRFERGAWRALRHGMMAAGLLWGAWFVAQVGLGHLGWDAHAYWAAWEHDLYGGAAAQTRDAYLYSPAFAEALRPLTALPFEAFEAVWVGVLVIATAWLLAPLGAGWGAVAFLFCLPEIIWGNVGPLLGLVAVLGFRYPGAWSFAFMTKVVPGIGVAWFAVRREWRALGWALGTTLAVVAVSVALGPGLWAAWAGVLLGNATEHHDTLLPLAIRAPVGLGIVVWGAWTGRRWSLPVAMLVAYPVLTVESVALLAAVPRLRERTPRAGHGSPRSEAPSEVDHIVARLPGGPSSASDGGVRRTG